MEMRKGSEEDMIGFGLGTRIVSGTLQFFRRLMISSISSTDHIQTIINQPVAESDMNPETVLLRALLSSNKQAQQVILGSS